MGALTDGRPLDALGLLLAVDALPPVTFNLGLGNWVPTLEITVYVRGCPQPAGCAPQWGARLIDGGWLDEDAEV